MTEISLWSGMAVNGIGEGSRVKNLISFVLIVALHEDSKMGSLFF